MTLRGCAPGTHARIRRITTDAQDRLRLAELGFVRGAEVRVVGRGATGGLLLALGDARVAVDDATAHAVSIQPVNDPMNEPVIEPVTDPVRAAPHA